MQFRSLGREDPLEDKMAIHSSILAWEAPWTEEPGGLRPIGLQRVGHSEGLSAAQHPGAWGKSTSTPLMNLLRCWPWT